MQQATLRLILHFLADLGSSPDCAIDTMDPSFPDLTLSGFDVNTIQTVTLPAGAADQVLAFTAVPMLLIVSANGEPFSVRDAAGETLKGPLYAYVLFGSDVATSVISTGVLLTGNGTNQALLKVATIEV